MGNVNRQLMLTVIVINRRKREMLISKCAWYSLLINVELGHMVIKIQQCNINFLWISLHTAPVCSHKSNVIIINDKILEI